jgi:energy-coupling factor transport system ATP-binding protein
VLGPSGSGKSTLTLCLDGLIPHLIEGEYGGEVVVAGLIAGSTPVRLLTQEAGLVFQDPESQFCTLTVEDEVAFGPENLGWPVERIESVIDEALAMMGLKGFRRRRLSGLSGGEKQRVALAAVLAMGPRVLVLDEPSANLDPGATAELFSVLKQLSRARRHTIVIIEHKLDEIIDWVDSVLVLGPDGHLAFRGDPSAAFYEHADDLAKLGVWQPQTAELVRALVEKGWEVPGRPLDVDGTVSALVSTPGLVARMRERSLPPGGENAGAGLSEGPILRTRALSFSYPDGNPALTDVSVDVAKGSFLAVLGVNGAGKTTLASLLSGVLRPPRGSVFLDGEDVAGLSAQSLSGRVGHVFQNPEYQFITDTVWGELAFSLVPRAGHRKAGGLSPDQEARVEAWLDRLDLLRLAEANPFTLSQGQKRRLSVAAMLIRGQDVLILDEPTLGQDELQATRLMAMMATLQREGKTVIMVTHDMRLVSENADALVVLSEGRVLYQGEPGAYFADPGLVKRCGLAVPVLGRMAAEMQQDHGVSARLNTLDAILKAAGSAMASSPATSAGPATTAGSATTASLGSTAHPGAAGPSTTAGPGGGAAAAARQTGRES